MIDADGNALIAAANSGEVRNEVVSDSVGSVTNEASEGTKALVRGVTVLAGGLSITADSNTTYTSSSLDAENRVTGDTSAKIDESVVTAGAGGVSVAAADRSTMAAYAEPFQPNIAPADAPAKRLIARVSVINEVLKNTTASIELRTIVAV